MKDRSLFNIFKYFFILGVTGFGGPLALIQQMRKDLVERRDNNNIMTETEFDQAFTMIKAMPGPISFQMAVYCGHKMRKFWGGSCAGVAIIFPAFLMMVLMANYYQLFISNVYLSHALKGAQYAVASIILVGLAKLSQHYHKKIRFWIFVLLSAAGFYFKIIPETALILGTGLLFVILQKPEKYVRALKDKMFSFVGVPLLITEQDKLVTLFWKCFETGAVVFGTGLAAFPFLQSAFVDQQGWMDIKTFNDAVSFGQMTPGPVTIAVTFMGYKMVGLAGAVVATVALFLPAFFHMNTWFPRALRWLSSQKWIDQFIYGSTAAVVGCVAVTVYNMNAADVLQYSFAVIFTLSLFLQFKWKDMPVLLIIFLGAVAEVLLKTR